MITIENSYALNRTLIRVGSHSLHFIVPTNRGQLMVEPYTVKSAMSMAANLREAFRESDSLSSSSEFMNKRVQVLIDSSVLLVPLEDYDENDEEELYRHSFPDRIHEVILHQPIAELNSVAVFAINKDLRMVVTDNFEDVRIMPLIIPVWRHLYPRMYNGNSKKLFAYFHDHKVDIFAFQKNRIKFTNSYTLSNAQDAAYFILYVFQQLAMDQKNDEIYLVGNLPEDMRESIQRWTRNAYIINPSAEYNRDSLATLRGIDYDVITFVLENNLLK